MKAWQARPLPRDNRDIFLGTNITTGTDLRVSAKVLATHMHVVGATGVGKSFFLEGVIKRLIEQGHGVCLMTPHADIYHRVLDYCAGVNITHPHLRLAERVIPFDISDTRQVLGFNPVALGRVPCPATIRREELNVRDGVGRLALAA